MDLILNTVNPLLRPLWSLLALFQPHLRGGGSAYSKKMVSVLHKELECKVEKLKYRKLEVMHLRMKNFQLVNKISWISPHESLTVVIDS